MMLHHLLRSSPRFNNRASPGNETSEAFDSHRQRSQTVNPRDARPATPLPPIDAKRDAEPRPLSLRSRCAVVCDAPRR